MVREDSYGVTCQDVFFNDGPEPGEGVALKWGRKTGPGEGGEHEWCRLFPALILLVPLGNSTRVVGPKRSLWSFLYSPQRPYSPSHLLSPAVKYSNRMSDGLPLTYTGSITLY